MQIKFIISIQKIKLLFGRRYIYTFMQKDEFINECKEVSKMW